MDKRATVLLILALLTASYTVVAGPAFSSSALVEDFWITLAPLPKPYFSALGAAAVDGKIYFIADNVSQRYDPETNIWTEIAQPSVYSLWGAVAACQNKIYWIGGAAETPTQVYDPTAGTWANRTSPPGTTLSNQAIVVEDRIYLIGGAQFAPIGILATSDVNYVYDTVTDSWSSMAPIPTPVSSYASAVLDGKIYIIGGRTATNKPKNATDLVQIFDPETNTWTMGTPMPVGVSVAGSCSTSGRYAPKRIYVVGGLRGYSGGGTSYEATKTGIDLNQVYDPETGIWSLAASLPEIRWGFSLVNVNDALYAVGQKTERYVPKGYDFPLPDVSVPAVSILSPGNLSYAAVGNSFVTVPLVFEADVSLSWVGYSLDGGANVTVVNGTSIELPVNSESLTLYANDTSGNWAVPVTVYFTVAWNGGTPPQPFPWLPVAGVSVAIAAVVAVAAVVYLKKRKGVSTPRRTTNSPTQNEHPQISHEPFHR